MDPRSHTMNSPRMIWNGQIIHLDSLKDRADRFDMVATSLSRQLRWGGLQTGTITVAAHSYLVYTFIKDMYPDNKELQYNALLHEIEEAFGVGDIVTEVKAAIFPDKAYYNEFKSMISSQFDLKMLSHRDIKLGDVFVAMAEALCILNNPEDVFNMFNAAGEYKQYALNNLFEVEQLSDHIKTNFTDYSNPEKSRLLFLDVLKRELNWGFKGLTK